MTAVDVVVVSFNSRDHLRACLEPLVGARDLTVIVVDNASTDGSLDTIADLPVTALPQSDNRGFAHGCNVGWRAGRAPYVLFLNPDATIDEASVQRLVSALEKEAHVGLVAPRLVDREGSLAHSQRRFPTLRSTFSEALFVHRLFPGSPWSTEIIHDEMSYSTPGQTDWVSGACLLVRRSVLERLGGFDDGFFLYREEVDLCRRVRNVGLTVRFEPEATAMHLGGASAPRSALLPVAAASNVRYVRKHHGRAVAFLYRVGFGLHALTHTIVARGGLSARAGHARSLLCVVSPPSAKRAPE